MAAAMALYSIKALVGIISPAGFGPFFLKLRERFGVALFDKDGTKETT